MTRDELLDQLTELAADRVALAGRKNQNYSGDDALANFTHIETISNGRITAAQGILVRLTDKLSRLGNLLFDGKDLVNEPIQDTLMDIANYADLMTLCLRHAKK
jgi:hypothetical protein